MNCPYMKNWVLAIVSVSLDKVSINLLILESATLGFSINEYF